MSWRVINPLSRYRNALRLRASDDPPGWIGDIAESHDLYWITDDDMTDGNPVHALESGVRGASYHQKHDAVSRHECREQGLVDRRRRGSKDQFTDKNIGQS